MGNLHEISGADRHRTQATLIREEVDRILGSNLFAKADRLCHFLRFIVEASLREGPEGIKETLIGVQVYGRPVGYDPKTEPIVRTQARRLRLKLEEYYAGPGRHDRIVITVPTGGYAPQFDIRPEAAPQLTVIVPEPPPLPKPPSPWRWAAGVVLTLLIGTALGVIWYRFAYHRKPAIPPHAVPVTRYQGFEFQPSLSRDGQRVAFVWNGTDNNYNIYVKNLDSGEPLRLTSDPEHDLDPTWSPDGRHIAFLRESPDGAKQVFIVPASGGSERLLCQTHPIQAASPPEASIRNRLPGPAWSPDGQFLAVTDRSDPQEADSLYLVSVQTGEKKRATFPSTTEAEGDYYPAFSPDGRTLAFVRVFDSRLSSDLYVQSLHNGKARRITFDSKQIIGLTWASTNRLVFASNRLGNSLLWSVSPRGGTPELIAGAGQNVSQPTASDNGRTLVYAENFRNTNIWRAPIGAQASGSPQQLIASSTSNDSAQYSPDGKRIVFVTDRSGVPELWTCRADGSHPVALFEGDGAPVGTPRWSPDGRQIVFDTARQGRSVIALVAAQGGSPRLLVTKASDSMMPSWSRDGRFVYFVSPARIELRQVWKQPVAGGPAVQVTQRGGEEAAESSDGRTLYYRKNLKGLWQAPVSGGTEMQVPGLEQVDTSRHFFVSRTGIYFLASENPPWTIHFYNFATRQTSDVATIQRTPEFRTPSLSVSPDEHWLLYTQMDQAGKDLMMLKNVTY